MSSVFTYEELRDRQSNKSAILDAQRARLSPAKSMKEVLSRIYDVDEVAEKLIELSEKKIRRDVLVATVDLTEALGPVKGREEVLEILDNMRALVLKARL